MAEAAHLPPHLIIDGNNLLCWKVLTLPDGRRVVDHGGKRGLKINANLSVRENLHWFREIKKGVSEATSVDDFHCNLKAPNLIFLNNLMSFVADQEGWSCTLFTDTTFEPLIRSADKRSPEKGYAKLWTAMKKEWGASGRDWIQPHLAKAGDGSKAQADHHLLAAAQLYKATHDVLIVSNDNFAKPGEGENFPDLFPEGSQRNRILVKFSMGANEKAEFSFPDPYNLLMLPVNDAVPPSAAVPESVPKTETSQPYITLSVPKLEELQCDGLWLRAMSELVSASPGASSDSCSARVGTGEACQMRVDSVRYPHISSLHLELSKRTDGVWEIVDHSKNGTYLADYRLPQGQRVELPEHGLLALSMPDVQSDRCVKLLFRRAPTQNDAAPAASPGGDAEVIRLMLHFELSDGQRIESRIDEFPFRIGRHAWPHDLGRASALLNEEAVWGMSSEHLQLLRFDKGRRALWTSNLGAKSNGTGLLVGGQHRHLGAGDFDWPLAMAPFDRAQPHVRLVDRSGVAQQRPLLPVLVWLTTLTSSRP